MNSHSSDQSSDSAKKRAAALQYDPNKNAAPTLIAKGDNALADEIIALAHENGVLVHEDPHLAEVLNALDVGQQVPEEIFIVVAELIAFSYVLQGKYPENWQGHKPINTNA